MNRFRKSIAAATVAGSLLIGGVAGAALYAATAVTASAAPSSSTAAAAASPAPPGVAPGGKFVSNEDATHEKGESAAREAQENAGQFPTVP